MKIIVISGTPGTGKTTVSKKISQLIDARIISLNELALSDNFNFEYDKKRETYIVEDNKFIPYIIELIDNIKETDPDFLIIESHFSDIIPDDFLNTAIVLRCDPDILVKRLQERGYKKEKVLENVQAEILGNCVNHFKQKRIDFKLLEIDTTNLNIESVAKIIIGIITESTNVGNYNVGNVDWLEKLFQENRLNDFFD